MNSRRRMIVQLTSLVDLLFIVMFLQYMELQEASARQVQTESVRRQVAELSRAGALRAEGEAKRAQGEAIKAKADANDLKEIALRKTNELTQQMQRLQSRNDELEQQLQDTQQRLATASQAQQEEEKKSYRQLKQVAEVVKDIVGVPADAVAKALKDAPEGEQRKIRQQLEEMKAQPAGKLVQHLRESAEIRKYCEIWDVHIYDTNEVQIKIKPKGEEGETGRFFIRDRSELANKLVSAAKDSGEPKSLVIICLTWGNANLRTRTEVQAGIYDAVTVLKPEWGGVKRIEVARLGYAEGF